MPFLQRPAHGADRRASGRSCLPEASGAPVGALGAQAAALFPGARTAGARCRPATLPARGRDPSAAKQSGGIGTGAARGGELRAPFRGVAEPPHPLPLRHPRRCIRALRRRARSDSSQPPRPHRSRSPPSPNGCAAGCCAGSPAAACSTPTTPATGSPGTTAASRSMPRCASPITTGPGWSGCCAPARARFATRRRSAKFPLPGALPVGHAAGAPVRVPAARPRLPGFFQWWYGPDAVQPHAVGLPIHRQQSRRAGFRLLFRGRSRPRNRHLPKRLAGEKTAPGRDGHLRRGRHRLERDFRLPIPKSCTTPNPLSEEKLE